MQVRAGCQSKVKADELVGTDDLADFFRVGTGNSPLPPTHPARMFNPQRTKVAFRRVGAFRDRPAATKIAELPELARTVITVWITKASLGDPGSGEEILERYGEKALAWWEEQKLAVRGIVDETELARLIVERLRAQEGWGRILREEGV